jgi:hypothetical protein
MKTWHVMLLMVSMYGLGLGTGLMPKKATPTEIIDSYERGRKDALRLKPLSWDLEMACASLWMSKLPTPDQ